MSTPQMQRTVPELLQDIVSNIQSIVRSEVRLAKTEIKEEASKAVKPGTALGAGLVVGLYGMGFLLLAVVYALSIAVAGWIAALIVGGVLAIASAIMVSSSLKQLKRVNPTPEKTIRSLEENVQWAKDQIK